jgi:hypothetical protein
MSGKVIRVLPMTDYDFTDVSKGGTVNVKVARQIDVSGYKEIDLIVRLHSAKWPGAGDEDASLSIMVASDGFTRDDPTLKYETSNIQASVTFSGPGGQNYEAAPALKIEELTPPLGGMLMVYVSATQDTDTTAEFTFTVSADLVAKKSVR